MGDFSDDKQKKVVGFIASNIKPEECKRIKINDIVYSHLKKKSEIYPSLSYSTDLFERLCYRILLTT